MSKRLRSVVVACATLAGVSALGAGPRVADAEPLPADSSLVRGQLDNGLHYVVRRHAQPPGRATLWLHMHTGSLNETDRQRGIAHYVEHMAFNGSTHFPPGSLVPFFESIGMTFGRDQNAFTNMEQTTYQLSLPNVATETLGKGMTYLADILDGLSLLPKEIDAERQIIQEERRRGLSGRQRVRDTVTDRIAPGSLWSRRETIGLESTIDAVVEKDFRDYYGRWYAASNATLLVVADADPAAVEKIVAERFAAAAKRERPVPQASGVVAYDKSFAIVATDPEIASEDVRIAYRAPPHAPVTTVEQFRDDALLDLARAAWNRRLEEKVARGGTGLSSARATSGDEPGALHAWEVSGRALAGRWKDALETLAKELQRARRFGFTAREIDDSKREAIADAERAVETEATTPAQTIVRRMNGVVTAGDTMISAKQQLELLRATIATADAAAVGKAFAAEFDPKAVAFVVELPAGAGVPTEAQVLEIGTKALAVEPTQDAEVAHATRFLETLPTPGEWKETDEHGTTRVASGWLSNGVRVHYRFMDERKDEVTVSISLYGGVLLETAQTRGLTSAAEVAWSRPATKSLSSTDVRELLVGKKVAVRGGGGGGRGRGRGGPAAGSPAVTLTVSGSPADLEDGMQLAYLLLTQPKVEPESFAQHQSSTRESIVESAKNPMALGQRTASSVLYPESDVRLQPLTVEQVDRWTVAAAEGWLQRIVKDSPVEVAVVGDLPKEKALALVARYLGSLAPRERVGPKTHLALRTLARAPGARRADRTLSTPTAQAFVLSGFYGVDESDVDAVRALATAARILSMRMTTEVREKAQLVYSIGAASRAATTFPGFGAFSAAAPTEPKKVPALVEKLAAMYAEFAKSGPTDEEVATARKQFAVTFAEQAKDPAWWLGRLDQLDFRGTKLDDVAADPAAYQALSSKQVKDAFARIATPENSIVVTVVPKAAPEGAKAPDSAPAPTKEPPPPPDATPQKPPEAPTGK